MKQSPFEDYSWENLTYQFDYFDCVYENLYPDNLESRKIIMNSGEVLRNSLDTKDYNFFDYYKDHFKDQYFDQLKTPHLILISVGTVFAIEQLIYDNETIDYLNQNGLEIYLWDNLFISNSKERKILSIDGHGDHLPDNIKAKGHDIIFNFNLTDDLTNFYSFELESIKKFVIANNLKNVTVYTNEYETDKVFEKKYPEFKLKGANIFVMTYRRTIAASFDDAKVKNHVGKLENKFLSLSLRYEVHRHLIIAYIINKSSIVSWGSNSREWEKLSKPSLEYLSKEISFNFKDWETRFPEIYNTIVEGNRVISDNTPIRLASEKRIDDIECGCRVPFPLTEYAKSFCHIVTETTFGQPFPSYSEKIINSAVCLKPFIMVGPPNNLKYLKALGFKTFDRWWDESYDSIEDHEQRILEIFKVIDYIDSFSLDDLKKMYLDMFEVIEHNYNMAEKLKCRPLIV